MLDAAVPELPTFEIEVEEQNQDYLRVRLISAPDHQGRSGRLLVPNPYREDYSHFRAEDRLKILGGKLYNSLFVAPGSRQPSEIGERLWKFYEARSQSVKANELCLRLLLDFSAAAGNFEKVLALPWEFLHDGQGFVVLEKRISIARRTTGKQGAAARAIEPPMKVLLTYAEPENLPKINGEKSLASIAAEIKKLELDLEVLPHATLDTFKEHIEQSGCHIIHFIGHGEAEPSQATGLDSYLYLESSNYESLSDRLTAKQLSDWIANADSVPKLFLFSSCRTAVSDQYFERGVAHALLNAEVEAVVAMQANVDSRDADTFDQAIYQSLEQQQRIDEAVWAGRQRLKQQGQGSFEPSARTQPVVEAPLKKLLGEEIELPAWGLPILLLNGNGWLGQAPPPDRIKWKIADETAEMVRIPEGNFYIDQYPVTSKLYSQFNKDHPQGSDNGDRPVTNITFEQAKTFAHDTGRHLPSDEEWKTAARSGIPDKNQNYPWGNDWIAQQCNTQEAGYKSLLPVYQESARYPKNQNPSGMCGILGNVAEFVVNAGNEPKLCSSSFRDSREVTIDALRSPPLKPTDKIGFRCAASWSEVKQAKAAGKVEFL